MKKTIYRSIGIVLIIALLLAIPAVALFEEKDIADYDHGTHSHDRGIVAGVDYPSNCPYCSAGTMIWYTSRVMCPGEHGKADRYQVKCIYNHTLGYVYNCPYCFGTFSN